MFDFHLEKDLVLQTNSQLEDLSSFVLSFCRDPDSLVRRVAVECWLSLIDSDSSLNLPKTPMKFVLAALCFADLLIWHQ